MTSSTLQFRIKRMLPLFATVLMISILSSCKSTKDSKAYMHQTPKYLTDTTVRVAAMPIYTAGKVKQLFMGDHYRKEWITPIEVPILDLATEKGGLKPLKKGGGMQTISLRFKGKDGKQYVIRSIAKDPSGILPDELQNTIASDVLLDQLSASHPYAATVIPALANIAGVYHTSPKLVWVPDTPLLGEFRGDLANMLALFEERPKGNESEKPSFGSSKKIMGTPEIMELLEKNHDNFVDQRFMARSRVFDMLIGDWDRHEDQWRWATFKASKGRKLRPIPRDRDQAFFNLDGVIPWFASRKWALRKMQRFNAKFRDLPGFNFGSRYLDRRFLNELTESDWVEIADSVRLALDDESLEAALKLWPKSIYELSGPEILKTLKARRDQLPKVIHKHYRFLSREVDIVGTQQKEFFQVERLSNRQTRVRVYKGDKKQKEKNKFYDRTFDSKVTKEIRLYGLGGNDHFHISGDVNRGIKVRIISGENKDHIEDSSRVVGPLKKTIVYNTHMGDDIGAGKETRVTTANDTLEGKYVYKKYLYPYLGPAIDFGFNLDDGVFLGGGITMKRHKFGHIKHAEVHTVLARVSFRNPSFSARYKGKFLDLFGNWDLNILAAVSMPQYVDNYFGMGNETEQLRPDPEYNWVRIRQVVAQPELSTTVGKYHTFKFGPKYEYLKAERGLAGDNSDITTFINDSISGIPDSDFEGKHYLGLTAGYDLDYTDNKALPTKGVRFHIAGAFNANAEQLRENFTHAESDFSFYVSIKKPLLITLAARFGGAVNTGKYPFYLNNTLGTTSNLRGHRRSRFSGKYSAYQNTELRVRLAKFNTFLVPMSIGVMGFADHGRVWVDGENSKIWHGGYGGGIWYSPWDLAVLNATYAWSEDDTLIQVTFKFFF